jgi:hypothetical protein
MLTQIAMFGEQLFCTMVARTTAAPLNAEINAPRRVS